MSSNPLFAISPVDGRYQNQTKPLESYFSEFALIKYRVRVEIEYFLALTNIPLPQLVGLDSESVSQLPSIYKEFSLEDARRIKELEATTNHDVKAVEYFIKEKFDALGLGGFKEFIHFGLTSQDINNTAIPLSFKEGLNEVLYPVMEMVIEKLEHWVTAWKDISMLARTHGQPASPTRLGKEIDVFKTRFEIQLNELKRIPFAGKFGGATGNFNAHSAAYPDTDWHKFGNEFLTNHLGMSRSSPTTQIEHYDFLAAQCDALRRIDNILIDFSRDVWQYISMGYFGQRVNKNEVGSSAMPHKVNPIDFENAEGNFGVANSLLNHLSNKLPISRLQRDLTDSTVLRNIGVPIAHILIACNSLLKGMKKIEINKSAIDVDLSANWVVVAEGIQNILRREGYPNPYEALKELTRTGKSITEETIKEFVSNLDVSDKLKSELSSLTPFNYTGQ